jgi:hypothetical protein
MVAELVLSCDKMYGDVPKSLRTRAQKVVAGRQGQDTDDGESPKP